MAGERAGNDALLQVEVTSGNFETVGGLQTVTFSSNRELIEITNYGSNEDKQYLKGAGIKNTSISASGFVTNQPSFEAIENAHRLGNSIGIRLFFSGANQITYSGEFLIPSLEFSPGYNTAVGFSLTLESDGAITKA